MFARCRFSVFNRLIQEVLSFSPADSRCKGLDILQIYIEMWLFRFLVHKCSLYELLV